MRCMNFARIGNAKLDDEEVLYIKNIHTWKNLENSVHFDTNISQNSLLIEEKKIRGGEWIC